MDQIDDSLPPAGTATAARRRRRRIAALAGAVALLTSAGVAAVTSVSVADTPTAQPASAKPARIVQVSGQLIPQDTVGVKYEVKGELIGTWTFPLEEAVTLYASDTRLIQKGTEYFRGCYNTDGDTECDPGEPRGAWRGDYIYWSSRDNRLIAGACAHAMNGGSGAFRGVRGLLEMNDVYAATRAGSTVIYRGEVILNAVDEPRVDIPSSSARTSSTSASAAGLTKTGC